LRSSAVSTKDYFGILVKLSKLAVADWLDDTDPPPCICRNSRTVFEPYVDEEYCRYHGAYLDYEGRSDKLEDREVEVETGGGDSADEVVFDPYSTSD
jgi:hypothetical protein